MMDRTVQLSIAQLKHEKYGHEDSLRRLEQVRQWAMSSQPLVKQERVKVDVGILFRIYKTQRKANKFLSPPFPN